MAETDPRNVGSTDSPMEDELEHAFRRLVDEGAQRLHRPWRIVLVTGLMGGTEIAFGVLALLAVLEATGNPLLGGLAFSIGFLALLFGRSELFTEGFLVPIMTVATRRASWGQAGKLWLGTLGANLVGGWIIMWLVMAGYPHLHATTIEVGAHFAEAPLSVESFSLAVLAGAAITLMTRMQQGTDSTGGKMVAAIAIAFILAGLQLFHSVLDSLLIFGALHTGEAPFGYVSWLRWFSYTVIGNILGGFVLVTLLRLVRSKERIQDERARVASE